jgi:hypothetical protein
VTGGRLSPGTTPGRPPALRITKISGTSALTTPLPSGRRRSDPLPRRLSRNVADTIGPAVPNPPERLGAQGRRVNHCRERTQNIWFCVRGTERSTTFPVAASTGGIGVVVSAGCRVCRYRRSSAMRAGACARLPALKAPAGARADPHAQAAAGLTGLSRSRIGAVRFRSTSTPVVQLTIAHIRALPLPWAGRPLVA